VTRALIIAAILFVPTSVCALDIGARLPIKYGEIFMVRNDGGIKNWTTHFPYGSICHLKWRLPMWLVVKHRDEHVIRAGAQTIRRGCAGKSRPFVRPRGGLM